MHGVVNFCTDGVRGITGILGVLGEDDEAAVHLSGLERGDGALGDTQSTKAASAP